MNPEASDQARHTARPVRPARPARPTPPPPEADQTQPIPRPPTVPPLWTVGPSPSPSPAPPAEAVCPRCHAWVSCCFCAADAEAMRVALRRIAELHTVCDPRTCPERTRLAGVHTGPQRR